MSQAINPQIRQRRLLLAYTAMLALGLGAYVLIRHFGSGLAAPPAPLPAARPASGGSHGSGLLPLLIALLTIIVAARALGAVFRFFRQPAVIGEVLAGILLGPSLLGKLSPALSAALFPAEVTPLIGTLAQVGVLLFMFVIGLELDLGVLRRDAHSTLAISHASILIPFVMGAALALWLYPLLSTADVSFTAFSLFLGISMSVTAFPVLARILSDRKLQHTETGTLALICAAVGDVTAWCLLAFVVGIIQARLDTAIWTAALTALYVTGMFLVVRPLAVRLADWYERSEDGEQAMMGVVCVMLLVSSMATEYIGIHTLFGAFLIGAVIPHESRLARSLETRLRDLVVVMFLPAFFAFSGLRTRIDLIGPGQWWICGVIVLVACLGKFGGTSLAARAAGLSWRRATVLGILMNTRGLMELIVLNIGLDLGVISPTLFAMLVLMALITTFLTTPVLDWLAARNPDQDGFQRGAAGA
ncbi:MAG: cation:proton antiporter [Armatimonadota bacterium]